MGTKTPSAAIHIVCPSLTSRPIISCQKWESFDLSSSIQIPLTFLDGVRGGLTLENCVIATLRQRQGGNHSYLEQPLEPKICVWLKWDLAEQAVGSLVFDVWS